MRLPVVDNLRSEIFVPVTPEMVWAQPTKELKDMTIAYVTGAGIHQKDQERYNLAGDFTWRAIDNKLTAADLMVTHGGYDNSDANKDINAMFPIDRMHEIAAEGFIGACAPYHVGFMGGGGDVQKFREVAGPAIAKFLKEEGVDGVVMTAG